MSQKGWNHNSRCDGEDRPFDEGSPAEELADLKCETCIERWKPNQPIWLCNLSELPPSVLSISRTADAEMITASKSHSKTGCVKRSAGDKIVEIIFADFLCSVRLRNIEINRFQRGWNEPNSATNRTSLVPAPVGKVAKARGLAPGHHWKRTPCASGGVRRGHSTDPNQRRCEKGNIRHAPIRE